MGKVNVILFFVIVFAGMASYIVFPAQQISEGEKRKLASFPQWDMDKYLHGKFTDSIDEYMDDHFPFRNEMIHAASVIRYAKGFHLKNQHKVFVMPKIAKKEEAKKNDPKDTIPNILDEYDEIASTNFLIINGCVYPMGAGSPVMGKPFAKMVNEYAEKLKGKTRVISAVAPLSSAFIPVEKYRYYNKQNKRTLLAIKNNLSSDAYFADVFEHLNNHASEKLFFNTDHHWTALGAYHAYEAYCSSIGLEPVPLSKMTKKTKYNFLGTLYERTRDESVRKNADTFVYYVPNVQTTAIRFPEYGYKGTKSSTFSHGSRGGSSYSTFISGDNPLMKITTNVKNGKKVVVVKNSMGNAFAVYLISHYEEVWVMDFRYAKQNLVNLIETNKINDLVFAIGMYGAMSHGTIGMMRRLGTQPDRDAPPPVPVTIPDSTAILPEPVELDSLK